MSAQEIIEEVEDNLDERFRLLEAKQKTIIVRLNEILRYLDRPEYLQLPEE